MKVYDAVFLRVLAKHDALALSAHAGAAAVGGHAIVAVGLDQHQAHLGETVEVRFAARRKNPIFADAHREVPHRCVEERLVGAACDAVVDDRTECSRHQRRAPGHRGAGQHGGAGEVIRGPGQGHAHQAGHRFRANRRLMVPGLFRRDDHREAGMHVVGQDQVRRTGLEEPQAREILRVGGGAGGGLARHQEEILALASDATGELRCGHERHRLLAFRCPEPRRGFAHFVTHATAVVHQRRGEKYYLRAGVGDDAVEKPRDVVVGLERARRVGHAREVQAHVFAGLPQLPGDAAGQRAVGRRAQRQMRADMKDRSTADHVVNRHGKHVGPPMNGGKRANRAARGSSVPGRRRARTPCVAESGARAWPRR